VPGGMTGGGAEAVVGRFIGAVTGISWLDLEKGKPVEGVIFSQPWRAWPVKFEILCMVMERRTPWGCEGDDGWEGGRGKKQRKDVSRGLQQPCAARGTRLSERVPISRLADQHGPTRPKLAGSRQKDGLSSTARATTRAPAATPPPAELPLNTALALALALAFAHVRLTTAATPESGGWRSSASVSTSGPPQTPDGIVRCVLRQTQGG
jgi:hypothetical protein